VDWADIWLQIWTQIAQVLAPFIAAGAVWVLKDLALHLTAKAKTAYVREFVEYLGGIVTQAVESTNETFVDALKKGRADGKLTKDEAYYAFRRTKNAVLVMVTDTERRLASKLLGDFDVFINTLIEQQVRQNKLEVWDAPTTPAPAEESTAATLPIWALPDDSPAKTPVTTPDGVPAKAPDENKNKDAAFDDGSDEATDD